MTGTTQAPPGGLRDHPLRRALIDEVHARPFVQVTAPQRASHLALLTGEDPAENRASNL